MLFSLVSLALAASLAACDAAEGPDASARTVGDGRDAGAPVQDAATPKDAAVPEGRDADTGSYDDAGTRGVLDADFSCEPTLASIRDEIFAKTCHWDTCHSHNGAAWGLGLIGEEAGIRAGLVEHPALSCEGWQLVTPGSPERSFLWHKLTEADPDCGDRMPLGLPPLPKAALHCIETWIRDL